MLPDTHADRRESYETTTFRPLGLVGALLFTVAPPIFLYQYWLIFYTTAVEENPSIGPIMAIACVATFASIPMMVAGRRKRVAPDAMERRMPFANRLSPLRRRVDGSGMRLEPEGSPRRA